MSRMPSPWPAGYLAPATWLAAVALTMQAIPAESADSASDAARHEVDAAVDPVWPRSPQEVLRVLAIHRFADTQQQVLARHPEAPARVVVDIVIGADGRVLGCAGSPSAPALPAPLVQALCEPLRAMYFGRKPAGSAPVGQPLVVREAATPASAPAR
ncbi:hypothetical protein [Ideonella sp.]|uniref:hypothetical protein n=1 Tax=Ideonella sp. TaxID=1929293 RepID=UPI002B462298|nr:hypothetical protein [Ideonella sp.]HJV72267.1 hypothetical protein [Ideonella sp.]